MVRSVVPLFFGLLMIQAPFSWAQVKPFFAEVKLQPVADSGLVRGEVIYHFSQPAQPWIFLEERGARIHAVFTGNRTHWTPHAVQGKAGSTGWESATPPGDTLQARILFTLNVTAPDGRVQVGPGTQPALPGLQGYWGFPVSDWLVEVPKEMGLETLLEGDFTVTKKGVRWVGLKLYASRPSPETWVRWTGWPIREVPLPVAVAEAPKEAEAPLAVAPKVVTLPVVTPSPAIKREEQAKPDLPAHEPEQEPAIQLAGKEAGLPTTNMGALTLVFPSTADTLPERTRFTDEQNRFWDTWDRLSWHFALPPADEAWDHLRQALGAQAYELGALTYGEQDLPFLDAYIQRASGGDARLLPLFSGRLDSLAGRDSVRGEERHARVYLAKAAGPPYAAYSPERWVLALDEWRARTDAGSVDSLVDALFEQSILTGFATTNWTQAFQSRGAEGKEAAERIAGAPWPTVNLAYRYSAQDSTWIIEETYISESIKNQEYKISYGFGLETHEAVRTAGGPPTRIKASGNRFWAFPDAEQATGIRFTGRVPGSFLLSQASGHHRFIVRFAALEQLMRETNPSRQALGVVMGLNDESPMLRRLALERAPSVPADQRKKALPALRKMADSDPLPALRKEAEKVYQLFNRKQAAE